MTNRRIQMSLEELGRLQVIERVKTKRLSQVKAAATLKLSTRQLRRLIRAYEQSGAPGLISKRTGKASNRRIQDEVKTRAISLLTTRYPDFGPTFAHEKLTEMHGFKFSVETLRQWMIEVGLWQGKKRRKARVHQQRPRRPQRGELVQIDGSPHDWFEGRRPNCCLLVFIDDATSELLALHFVEHECLQGYFKAVEQHVRQHGRPLAYYSDKHSIFRVPIKEAKTGDGQTQLSRALKELGIDLICANTPQAKGRVEKANQTLQDRLVKELRLHNISDINTANVFLPTFIKDYNARFAVKAAHPVDAHRLVSKAILARLPQILIQKHQRKISKNLQLQYQHKVYQIQAPKQAYTLRGATITVCDNDGDISLLYQGNMLSYKVFDLGNEPVPVMDSKAIQASKPNINRPTYKPPANHPWRQPYKSRQIEASAASG